MHCVANGSEPEALREHTAAAIIRSSVGPVQGALTEVIAGPLT